MKKGWQTKKIGDVCRLMTGGTPSRTKPEYFGGDIKWLVSGDIHHGEILDCEGRITEAGMKNSNAKLLPVNSVMIALNGQGKTRGTVALLRTRATCNQSLVSIFPNKSDELLPEFLYANLHGRYQEIRQMTGDSGNDRRGLNMVLIKSMEIPIAPLPEQQRIVSILDEAFAGLATTKDNAEKNLQNARALFESYLESVFIQRGPGWEERRLGELATFRNGINFTKASRGESVKIVGVKDFQHNYWAPLDNLDTVIIDGALPDSDALRENDILFVRSNGNIELIGRCLQVGAVAEKIVHSGFTIRARLNGSGLSPSYLCHFLKSNAVRKSMTDSGIGTNIKSLNQATLSALIVPIPPSAQQTKIVYQIEALKMESRRLSLIYRQKVAALEALKKSLLHQAFTGNL